MGRRSGDWKEDHSSRVFGHVNECHSTPPKAVTNDGVAVGTRRDHHGMRHATHISRMGREGFGTIQSVCHGHIDVVLLARSQ